MNTTIQRQYQKERGKGWNASQALHNAKISGQWETLEDLGFVRFMILPDESPDLSYLEEEHFLSDRQGRALAKQTKERAENDGTWGIVGEYRTSPDSSDEQWETGDSCWGFVGDDWRDSGYDIDVKAQTIESLKCALRSRCPHCHRSARK